MTHDYFEKQLKALARDIINKNVIVVAGTGVSLLSLDPEQQQIASWKGLLRSGVAYCMEHDLINEKQQQLINEQIESDETIFMTCAAQQIVHFMGGRGDEFKRWIKETVAILKITDDRLIKKILLLNCPIITTNYDDLIEQVCGFPYYTANDEGTLIIEHIIDYKSMTQKNYKPHVIHLHGHYRHTESLVLDISSYEDITRNQQIQQLLKSIDITLTYLFIGCGIAGLTDPNFGPLLHRSNELFSSINAKHYRLVREDEMTKEPNTNKRMMMLNYGKNYADLPIFMDTLLQEVANARDVFTQLEREKYTESEPTSKKELEILSGLIKKTD
jgi:SIR2-like domain